MTSFIEPNIHPVLVHFAYALSVSSAICYLAASFAPAGRWRDSLRPAADWMLAFGALAIVATVAAGFQAYYSVGHDGPSHAAMTTHRNWAVPSALAILALSTWRWRTRTKAASGLFAGLLGLAAISLSVTAWWGGHIVYNYGLGVNSLPAITGDGHDHDHGEVSSEIATVPDTHDNADGHHDAEPDAVAVPDGHDNSDGHHDTVATPETIGEQGSPESVVDAFSAALSASDRTAIQALMAADAIIAEGGGAEWSFEEYADHHMPADMAFTAATSTTVQTRKVIAGEQLTTVISQSQIHGVYKGETIHSQMIETMVLRNEDEGWRIAHIHWSSAPITGEHEH